MTEPVRVIRLDYEGREFTFRVLPDPPHALWQVECDGLAYKSPVRVTGTEGPEFFRALAKAALVGGHVF
jgi:hypothetical protein